MSLLKPKSYDWIVPKSLCSHRLLNHVLQLRPIGRQRHTSYTGLNALQLLYFPVLATTCSSECEVLEVKDIISYNMYVSFDCVVVVTGLLGCDTV